MNRLSNTAQVDINIYTSEGMLLRTTRSEIFDSYLLGTRIDPEAYKEIVYNNKKQFINRETLGNLSYFSLYAPLFNVDGKLIAIVNIPYFARESSFSSDASSIIAAIINIYLLLMIGAVFVGIALSNSIARPLIEISRKMQLLDISEQPEHINYNHRDELGILVAAYNKMVDDVDESTKRLAQSEREQAWREMARQIAHEIKNPLTPMRLSIQHMMRLKERNVPDWNKKFDTLAKSLIEQIDILSEAAGEFSSFSRFYYEKQASFDLVTLIREQIVLFNTRDNVAISLKTGLRNASVYSRKGQITRVLVNLLSNAVQALEKEKEGEIAVALRKDGAFWEISIDDSGAGVPKNLRYRLFKPNFTTKSGGTGLGLAICRSIMEQSGGTIHYEKSPILGGASFVVRMPVVEDNV
jgi:two-component system, NtrC family, nitrogen regulation sensor histidine kinase NtrY